MTTETKVKLHGSLIISGLITTKTGLLIGGTDTGISIGGVDKTVVRNSLKNEPYIPGSSLRGKMRSLLEKAIGLEQNSCLKGLNETKRCNKILIHACLDNEIAKDKQKLEKAERDYKSCPVCQLFGVSSSEHYVSYPSRLIVRDAKLEDKSATDLQLKLKTDMPFTEIKTEVVIDRLTSAANPRNFERVPAGAKFKFEIVFNFYKPDDFEFLKDVFLALSLVEADALGGQGSRGYGQISFDEVKLEWKPIHNKSFQPPPALKDISESAIITAIYERLKGA